MADVRKGLENFARLETYFHSLIDQDPVRATSEVRALPDMPVDGVNLTILKASVLIDGGCCADDPQSISDGIEMLRKMLAADPDNAVLHYNLGNGLVGLADHVRYSDAEWYLATAEERRSGRNEFHLAVVLDGKNAVTSIALTNLGNAFWKAHRWVEAYDAYSKALEQDATNGVAGTGAAKILLRCVERHIGEPDILLAVAARHLQKVREHPDRIAELAGVRAFAELRVLLEKDLPGGEVPDLSTASDYEKFVARHRLALSPTIEGLDLSLKRWDSLSIHSLVEPISTEHGVPPLFAMFNVMKADFLAARMLAYQALETRVPDTGLYADTLDYAVYGITPSVLSLAQRVCIDVLDKVAVAATEYFEIPSSKRAVGFLGRWFDPKRGPTLTWHPAFAQAAKAGNSAVIALGEMSLDIANGGAFSAKREYRHSSTHRFTVLHDTGCDLSRKSAAVEHCSIQEFGNQLIESLQLARAALMYFVEMVSLGERGREKQSGLRVPLFVPDHHWVRGEDDDKEKAGGKMGTVPRL
jgi:tetratricopeptide (TPR) repeat protein